MRIVLKFGTGILTRTRSNLIDQGQITRLAAEVAALVKEKHECIIVSSGAVGAGLRVLGLKDRPSDLASVQACAAIGQSKLMQHYEHAFAGHGLNVAQLLLTHGDLDSRTRHRNAKNTLDRLLATRHVVPIINENDSVATEELARLRDNDRLSADVALLARADLLILLTSVDGVLDERGKRIARATDVASLQKFVREKTGRLSVGGMASKLEAVSLALEAGISAAIASGRRPGRIGAIVAGKNAGTRFVAGK